MGWDGIKDYGFGSKNRTPQEDAEYRSRIKGVPKTITWTKEKCVEELNDILDILKKILKDDEKLELGDKRKLKNETIRDVTTLMNKILDYMRYLYPQTQTNVNVNIDVELNDVIEKWREAKKKKQQEIVVLEEVQNEQ